MALALLMAAANAFADGNSGTLTQKREIVSMTAVYAGMTLSEMGSGVVVFTVIFPMQIDHLPADLDKEPGSVETATSASRVLYCRHAQDPAQLSRGSMTCVCGPQGDCTKQICVRGIEGAQACAHPL